MVTARTLVVAGAANPAGLTAARNLADAMAAARLEVVPDAGASVPLEASSTFNRLLYGFLDEAD